MKGSVSDSIPFENQARECVQWIEDRIKAALSPAASKVVTEGDKASLERELDNLHSAFENLTNLLIEPLREQKPNVCSFGYCELRRLMWAAFIAGSRAIVSDSAQRYTNRVKALKSPRSKKKVERHAKLKRFLRENSPHQWVIRQGSMEEIRRF